VPEQRKRFEGPGKFLVFDEAFELKLGVWTTWSANEHQLG